jgi:hypothetical protein
MVAFVVELVVAGEILTDVTLGVAGGGVELAGSPGVFATAAHPNAQMPVVTASNRTKNGCGPLLRAEFIDLSPWPALSLQT